MKLDNITKFMLKWKWLIGLFLLILGVIIYDGINTKKTDIKELKRTEIRMLDGEFDNVSDIELVDIKGEKTFLIDRINSERSLFIYAAEWCGHCRKFLPVIENFKQVYGNKYNIIVVFSGTSTKEAVTKYVSENKFSFDWYYDKDLKINERLFIQGVPFPVILEKKGNVINMKYYLIERENIAEIEKAVSQ